MSGSLPLPLDDRPAQGDPGDLAAAAIHFGRVLQSVPDIAWIKDRELRLVAVNEAYLRACGLRRDDVIGRTRLDLFSPDVSARCRAADREVLASGTHRTIEVDLTLADGSAACFETVISPLASADGRVAGTVGIARDVTRRRRAEDALQASERWYRSLIENATEPVSVVDAETRFSFASATHQAVLGYSPEELLGRCAMELIHPDDAARAGESLAALAAEPGGRRAIQLRFRHKNGQWRVLDLTGWNLLHDAAVGGIVLNASDVTEQLALEAQLRQAQKMEAVGRLAGGIAHDFNNLLTAILSNSELVLGELPDGPIRRDVQVIRHTAERAAGLTRRLLAFSRKHVVQPQVVDLNAVLAETEQMLARVLGTEVTLELDHAPGLGGVLGDPIQFEQVLVNLAVNARDAMPEGGVLGVQTSEIVVDATLARRHRGLRPGSYVALLVRDSGCGMDQATQARIFEPFFTTKPPEKGTGLGLSTVYGIVKQWGGYVAVESEPGAGSVFTVYLPRYEQESGPALPAASTGPEMTPGLCGGAETVLLVEDEAAVRSSIRRILIRYGYTVIEARHGADAIQRWEERRGTIELVLTDVVMPEMGGRELVSHLMADPRPPRILVMSGYDEGAVVRGEMLPHAAAFIEKPFTVEGLLKRVREVLESAPAV